MTVVEYLLRRARRARLRRRVCGDLWVEWRDLGGEAGEA